MTGHIAQYSIKVRQTYRSESISGRHRPLYLKLTARDFVSFFAEKSEKIFNLFKFCP